MPDAPTPDDLAEIRANHAPSPTYGQRCVHCGGDWPCDAARLLDRLDAAEVRLLTKRGGTVVVTAAELWRGHQEAVALHERAAAWAQAWKRAAKHGREMAHDARADLGELAARDHALRAEYDAWLARAAVAGMYPAEVAAVVEAARALGLAGVGGAPRALREALAALDAAMEEDDDAG